MRSLLERVHALPFRVATKFAVTFTVGALTALALVVMVLALHERRAVTVEAMEDLEAQGDALAPHLIDILTREGEASALEALRAANAANARTNVTLHLDRPSSPPRMAEAPPTDRFRIVVPLEGHGLPPGYALVLERVRQPDSAVIAEAAKVFLFAAVPLGLFAMISAFTLGEWLVGAPLRRVAERAEAAGEGDLDNPLEVRGSVEIMALKRSINAMLEDLRAARVKASEQEALRIAAVTSLRHADRLRTVGTLAAGVAHELGTPLNVILLECRNMEQAASSAHRIEEGTRRIRAQATRMVKIIRQMLDFARRKSPARVPRDAVEVVKHSVELVAALAREKSCTIEVAPSDPRIPFSVDESGVQQILTNLFVNAFDAMAPAGGRVVVRVHHIARSAPRERRVREWVGIEVEDEGSGMEETVRAQVFEPFFTTKDVGSGTGLGLSVALGIAEDHGGFMEVRPSEPRGTVFALYLPADEARRGEVSKSRTDAPALASPA